MAASKNPKSIKSRIDELVSKLGELPAPSPAFIKGKLVAIGVLVEALEEGEVIRDAEEKVTVLEAALEKSNLENSHLQAKLKSLNTEVDGFRAERKKQEEEKKREDIPDIQLQILRDLPTEHAGDGSTLHGICQRTRIPPDEAEIYLDRLENSGFAKRRYFASAAGGRPVAAWYRTIRGNELIFAKRLAGEEQTPQRKYPDLRKLEETMLEMMIGESEGIAEELIHAELEKKMIKSPLRE